jgi:hypothetical protein
MRIPGTGAAEVSGHHGDGLSSHSGDLGMTRGSDGPQRLGPGHDPAKGADFMQVTEHLDADGLVQAAHQDTAAILREASASRPASRKS